MLFRPAKLGKEALDPQTLQEDRSACRRFGPCGAGKKALYLNSFYIDCRYYVPIRSVTRVFKRVAMSKGGFSGKGVFASIPYLVVEFDDGREKQCNFKHEEQVDAMLAYVQEHFPGIKTRSLQAELKLAERDRERAARKSAELSDVSRETIRELTEMQEYLEKKPSLFTELTAAARKKRTFERSNPSYKWVALSITLMGAGLLFYGIYAWINHQSFAVYFMLLGLAGVFLFSGVSVLPTGRSNRKAIESRLDQAEKAAAEYISAYPDFPVPARYAHPMTLKRMRDAVEEGHAETAEQAFEYVKNDLKRLNADVEVEQDEFEEIMSIKPMFLVWDYR